MPTIRRIRAFLRCKTPTEYKSAAPESHSFSSLTTVVHQNAPEIVHRHNIPKCPGQLRAGPVFAAAARNQQADKAPATGPKGGGAAEG